MALNAGRLCCSRAGGKSERRGTKQRLKLTGRGGHDRETRCADGTIAALLNAKSSSELATMKHACVNSRTSIAICK